MRSINRGPWPTGNDGFRIPFPNYRRAKTPLTERIGEYCSYCERRGDLHVEHVVPKSVPKSDQEQLETEWSNFLLGCANCNSRKSNKNKSREGYLWPDLDDTFRAFAYRSGGRVTVSANLAGDEHRRASALFDLVGLGEAGTHTDPRRHKRRQAWDQAVNVRGLISNDNSRVLAVKLALETGFFSVWMAVFHDDEDMRRRLIAAFPGTRAESARSAIN